MHMNPELKYSYDDSYDDSDDITNRDNNLQRFIAFLVSIVPRDVSSPFFGSSGQRTKTQLHFPLPQFFQPRNVLYSCLVRHGMIRRLYYKFSLG